MPPEGFEPETPASERPQTHALDCAATDIGNTVYKNWNFLVLYGCDTWSFTLREEHWLRVFEDRLQRGVFGPRNKREQEL
jgi:hypothetical protein